jgi:hypothetical protein
MSNSVEITLQVSQDALDNFKSIIEAETGYTVTDAVSLLKSCLDFDINKNNLDSYTYMVTDSDEFLDDVNLVGLKK